MTGAEPGRSDTITPDVTVVVVNYNGGDYLRGCIASLAHQTHRSFETIVIDSGP